MPDSDIITADAPNVNGKISVCMKCRRELAPDMLWCPYCGKKQTPAPRKRRKRANGTGTIYKLSGHRKKPWAAKKNGVYVGFFATEKAAQEALERLAGYDPSTLYNLTFAEIYDRWKPEHFPTITPDAQRVYEHSFKVFSDLHKRKFRELRTSDYQLILDRYTDLSSSAVNKLQQLLTQLSKWAIKNDVISVNYASRCTNNGRSAEHHEPLTADDIAKLERDGSEAARVVLMLLATGMRIGELFKLPLADYHETYVVGGEKTEAGCNRVIPIRPEGRPHFAHFAELANAAGGTRLIDGYKGNRTAANFRKRDYAPLLERLGIDPGKTPHSTRVTYATRAATDDELSPATLGKVLGHKQFSTTQQYYNRPAAEQLVKAVEKGAARSRKKKKAAG